MGDIGSSKVCINRDEGNFDKMQSFTRITIVMLRLGGWHPARRVDPFIIFEESHSSNSLKLFDETTVENAIGFLEEFAGVRCPVPSILFPLWFVAERLELGASQIAWNEENIKLFEEAIGPFCPIASFGEDEFLIGPKGKIYVFNVIEDRSIFEVTIDPKLLIELIVNRIPVRRKLVATLQVN